MKLLWLVLLGAAAWFIGKRYFKPATKLQLEEVERRQNQQNGILAQLTEQTIIPPISYMGRQPYAEAVIGAPGNYALPTADLEFLPAATGRAQGSIFTPKSDYEFTSVGADVPMDPLIFGFGPLNAY